MAAHGRAGENSVHHGARRAVVLALLLLVAAPAAAGAATVSVEPFVERLRPGDDGFGSCGRYRQCPADMVVFTAASGETNRVTITQAVNKFERTRYLVLDRSAAVVAGAGCERVDEAVGRSGRGGLHGGGDWPSAARRRP